MKNLKIKNIKNIKNKKFKRGIVWVDDLENYFNIGYLGNFGGCFCDYKDGYICDIITEIADSKVDTYTSDLLEWAKGNYSYIEEAISEFGFPEVNGQPDFIRCIMQGQYYANEQDIYENLENSIKNLVFYYIKHDMELDYITKKQADKILKSIDFENNNEQIENIFEQVEEILENEKILI